MQQLFGECHRELPSVQKKKKKEERKKSGDVKVPASFGLQTEEAALRQTPSASECLLGR